MLFVNQKLKEPLYLTGLILVLVSFLFFLLPAVFPAFFSDIRGGVFLINFSLAVAYILLLFFKKILKRGNNSLPNIFLFLILFLISAYSLNREMLVFERSVNWFIALLIIVCVNYILFIFFKQMPRWMQFFLCMISGIAMVIFFYLAAYLVPLYLFSAVAAIALGVSLHTFVPILFCIYTIVLIRRANSETKRCWLPFGIGVFLPIVFVIVYTITWNRNLTIINNNFRYASITANNQLPSWVGIAQQAPKNAITESILKTGLVYSVPHSGNGQWFWNMPSLNFETKMHDPLIMISTLLCGPARVPERERIKILETMYDSRHEAEERLWAGKDLYTERVNTNIQLWPALRIAYSELEVVVTHLPYNASWTNTQEAIYTFHLPEGGVVTSLSLWIDGKEEKGILTTKSKADTAYKTIVGVEKRDPSVVHWQEGNTVTVRVFPILKGESRKFKLGITAPLIADGKKIKYNNIYFDGPPFGSASEAVHISSPDPLDIMDSATGFAYNKNHLTKDKGKYNPDWSISFNAPELQDNSFSFNNYTYQVAPVRQEPEIFNPQSIYLDINSSWMPAECDEIFNLVKNKNLYVSDGGEEFKRVTESNKDLLFKQLRTNNFSLFPFFLITDSAASLVISKSSPLSPTIDDLRTTSFLSETYRFFTENRSVRFFNLGKDLSPYLKSLKEFRMLEYDQGSAGRLKELLSKHIFIKTIENDNEIAIYDAGIVINRSNNVRDNTAPDHLMRLFAYNHILQRSGASILADTLVEEPLIKEAEQAYVVSPFSSLIVLETQKDYDRFNITASKNSLQNASSQSKGAVPEPHEWALIILVIVSCTIIRFRPKILLIRNK